MARVMPKTVRFRENDIEHADRFCVNRTSDATRKGIRAAKAMSKKCKTLELQPIHEVLRACTRNDELGADFGDGRVASRLRARDS